MALVLHLTLISAKRASLEANLDASVESFHKRARRALGVGKGRLVNLSGSVLGGDSTLSEVGLRTGDCLTLHIGRVQIGVGRNNCFAAMLGDGSVVTWGNADCGGDSSVVREQLKNVQQIQATMYAFAAILADGSVVTWDNADCGGGSVVREQLKNVQQIQATELAFGAILGDGSVVTWGDADCGGDSSVVREQLKNVQQMQANDTAFAAILGDGSVVTRGDADCGGDSSVEREQIEERVADPSNTAVFCCHPGRWVCGDMGQGRMWWWQ